MDLIIGMEFVCFPHLLHAKAVNGVLLADLIRQKRIVQNSFQRGVSGEM